MFNKYLNKNMMNLEPTGFYSYIIPDLLNTPSGFCISRPKFGSIPNK